MIRWLPILILVAGFFLFLPNYKSGDGKYLHQLENGCLIYALHMKMTIDANERLQPHLWSRIIAIQFHKRLLGHAILVFVYKNMTFIYDPNIGSYPAARYPVYDPKTIAEIAYPKIPIESAHFIEPTITLTYP
jgi:hypothetical protein